jgi:hypothetical protein
LPEDENWPWEEAAKKLLKTWKFFHLQEELEKWVWAVTGSITFTINPGPANWINLTVPDTITAGQPFPVTVTVRDAFNNPVTGYTGTVHFTATNGVTANYAFTPTDMSSHTFTVGVPTPQTLTITAADSVNPAICCGRLTCQVVSDTNSGSGAGPDRGIGRTIRFACAGSGPGCGLGVGAGLGDE